MNSPFTSLLPLLALLLRPGRWWLLLAGSLVAMYLWRHGVALRMPDAPIPQRVVAAYQLPGSMDAFGFGMLSAYLYVNRLRLPGWVLPGMKLGRLGLPGLALVLAATWWLPGKRHEYWADNPIFYLWTPALVLGVAAIILAGVGGGRIINRLFTNRFMIYAGLVSYSYYMWHFPVLGWIVATEWFQGLGSMRFLALLLASAPLIFMISTLSYVLIEVPGMRFRRGRSNASREDRNFPDPADMVDVIIPVYAGFEETRRCIESVLKAHCATAFELVLIDDASPEPELVVYCESLRNRPGVTLLVNQRNLGYVETVNIGMRLHPDRDVVLLNSDTEVADGWLDRLQKCVHSAPDIATATPFSNYATICSYPVFCADNAMPPDVSLAELDRLFARVNAGAHVDIPTAVGFCMYIRRPCLAQVGLFDAEQFGRGYGEENDFSRRAAKAGWRNVLCADTFVFHAGGVSFGTERATLAPAAAEALSRLHPEYAELVQRFVAEDSPAKFRRAVDMGLVRRRKWRNWAGFWGWCTWRRW